MPDPTFQDKLRALGLPTERDADGDYFQRDGADLCDGPDGWSYRKADLHFDPRRWPTSEAAVDELYAERNEGSPGVAPTKEQALTRALLTNDAARHAYEYACAVHLHYDPGQIREALDRALASLGARVDGVPEPSVDEMAREMGLYYGKISAPGREADGEPAWFADERMIPGQYGALYISRSWAPEWRPLTLWTCRDDRSAGYATDEIAIRTLYREHKAKQGRPPLTRFTCSRADCDDDQPHMHIDNPNQPPIDPAALARWLYERVVPGQTRADLDGAAEHLVMAKIRPTATTVALVLAGLAGPVTIPRQPNPGEWRLTRLLNPDGSVLWSAK